MTSPLTPIASSSDKSTVQQSALMTLAGSLATAGAISLAVGATSPHRPIAVVMGMHAPLILAIWMATGLDRGRSGAGVGLSLRILWCILLYVSICSGTMLMLGVAHVLTRGAAFFALSGVGMLLMVWAASRSRNQIEPNHRIGKQLWIWCPICLIVAIVATHALLNPQYDFDMLYYHLFVPARWAHEGKIFLVPIHFGEFAPTYYPYAAELYYLSLMLPMGSDHLARGGQIVFFLELMAVVAALGRELRMKPFARVAAIMCVILTPAFAWQAGTANVDLALTAHLIAVALFSIRLARRPSAADAAGLILAGGLAVGTKVLALPYLAALSPLWGRAAISLIRHSRSRSQNRTGNSLHVLAALAGAAWIGGYWYARNWLRTGNPLYPLKVTFDGLPLFDGVFDRAAMINSSFNQSRHGWFGLQVVLRDLLRMPPWFEANSWWGAGATSTIGAGLVLVSMLVAAILSLTHRRFRIGFTLPLVFLSIVAMFVLYWWSVPYQITRFLWPPIALSIIAVFAVISRLPVPAARLAMCLLGGAWLVLFGGELSSTFVTPIATAVCLGAISLFALHTRAMRFAGVATACAVVIGIWAALCSIERAGDPPRRTVLDQPRWRNFGDAWKWVDDHAAGKTIAYAGHNIPYFWMGARLQNRVVHVLAGGEPGWDYHDFAMSPAARALGRPNVTDFAATRVNMDGRTWLRGMIREHVDYVVVSRLFHGVNISHRHDRDAFPIERQWLDTLANARDANGRPLATRTIFGGGWLLFYRLNLPSDETQWPQLSTIVQTETDALDRRRRDGTTIGSMIDGYPFAAQSIEEMKLDAIPDDRRRSN